MKMKFLFLSFFLIGFSLEAKQTLKNDSIKKGRIVVVSSSLILALGGAYLYLGLIHRDRGNAEEARKNFLKAVNLIHKVRESWDFEKAQGSLRDLESR